MLLSYCVVKAVRFDSNFVICHLIFINCLLVYIDVPAESIAAAIAPIQRAAAGLSLSLLPS